MTSTPLVLPFSAIRSKDLPLVGGKGANLGEMTHAGFPVPPGFCVTTAAFRRFMAAHGQANRLYALLDELTVSDVDEVRRVGELVRRELMDTPMPEEVSLAILETWREEGGEYAYAVRSSATAEDLPDASFAGQQDTFLNVRGEDALLDAVKMAWISLFTDRAILYRIQNDFDHRAVALAVVVQRMVMADISGALFTADPVTGHRHTLVINACFGLGEALVSGLVTPDTYRVDKRTGEVISKAIEEKVIAIYALPDGGTQQVILPPDRRSQPSLTDIQVQELTELGSRVEAHYGHPQDIEWAIAEDTLFLLQTRPITSLYPIDGLASPDDSLRVYFSIGHQQGMTRAMAPLSLSTFPLLLPPSLRRKDGFHVDFLRVSGGRLFADVTPLMRHPLLRRVLFAAASQFDVLAPAMLRTLMQRPEFRSAPAAHLPLRQTARLTLPILKRMIVTLTHRDLTGFREGINQQMDAFIAEARQRLQAAPSAQQRVQVALETLPTLLGLFLHWVPEAAVGLIVARILPRLAQRYLPPEQAAALSLGIPGNVVNEMNLAIGDLADVARRSPALTAHFDALEKDAHAWLAQAVTLEGAQPFFDAWRNFLTRYGMRGPSEIDISSPRWLEDPLPLLQVIANHLHGKPGRHHRQWQALVKGRETAIQNLLDQAGRGLLGRMRQRIIRRLYHVMVEVGGMREHHKFLAIRLFWEVKQTLYPCQIAVKRSLALSHDEDDMQLRSSVAEVLIDQGKLTQPGDIWLLEWQGLARIWQDDKTDWRALIAERRTAWKRYQKLSPPIIITSDGETPVVTYDRADLPPDALVGNPVSAGVIEGPAHVVRDPHKDTLRPGEILVAEFTDPGWTPLFINAGGLVLEVGGVLTHGAVVAREYGIPAVVGVREATKKIRTGQRIRVDGNRGVVEIL